MVYQFPSHGLPIPYKTEGNSESEGPGDSENSHG